MIFRKTAQEKVYSKLKKRQKKPEEDGAIELPSREEILFQAPLLAALED